MKRMICTICLSAALVAGFAHGSAAQFGAFTNHNSQNYGRWAAPVRSHLVKTGDGFEVVMGVDGRVTVQKYDGNFRFVSELVLPAELPLFGGYLGSGGHHYVLYGQYNERQDNAKEAFRVVKYGPKWERIGAASVTGNNTTRPFEAGSARMVAHNGFLFVRAARTMYRSPDGLNHQASITFSVDTASMKLADIYSKVMNISCGYVSHSFNQFIDVVQGRLVAVDHGDAYPRSVVLVLYNSLEGGQFTGSDFGFCSTVPLLKIAGSVGDNTTNATVGGFESGRDRFMAAGSSIDQGRGSYNSPRNIFVSTVPLKDPERADLVWITAHDKNRNVGTPHLVKIGADAFVLLWSEGDSVKYCAVDNAGKKLSEIRDVPVLLSDCKPVVHGGRLTWFYALSGKVTIYSIDVSDLKNPILVMPKKAGK